MEAKFFFNFCLNAFTYDVGCVFCCFENYITTLNIGLNMLKFEFSKHFFQSIHLKHIVPAYVDASKFEMYFVGLFCSA